MQDEVNEKVVSLAIKTSKLTAEVLQKAMKALLAKGKGQLTKALRLPTKISKPLTLSQGKAGLITTSRRLRTASRRPTLCLLGARILTL